MAAKPINNDKLLETLQSIGQVDAPEFLFTRINHEILNRENSRFSKPIALLLGSSFALLIYFNFSLLTKYNEGKLNNEILASSMQLVNNNSLYHE